ncbi:FAD-binding and (Fe-S)-binding domain-containing protein [Carboxydocella sp. JDF658]|uniref:FAD-binding and (Fe-S)-binding domain-containing protein n=1 Tax=Carboxydocella sp. JDF658 TaxID=1926600 RepID=UPI0009ADCACA|nr:FAD-binding and (Fe-S)-binding domain-containing protein [Carboxydocella sp. JDF658]GAW32328.1 heterodisulfide reductase [Carboxydocella sp. JDF658]
MQTLKDLFGNRFRDNQLERLLYSHDVGVLPAAVKKTFNSMPSAVVQPENKQELIDLMKWANETRTPLIPRGAATSGFGGAIPTKGGVVVDLIRMKNIIAFDPEQQTVTVEPGIVWEELDSFLASRGYTLRLYPSSYPGSTVGGWTAQGGTGLGSYRYGSFKDNLVEVKAILGDGTERTFSLQDLDLIYGLEGITGIIYEITLKVMKQKNDFPLAAVFSNLLPLPELVKELENHNLPVWNITVLTPEFIALHQSATREKVLPEDKYLVNIVLSSPDEKQVDIAQTLIARAGGQLLSSEAAHHEWNNRFYTMRLKRLGPSLIASEVIVPLAKAAEFIGEVEHKFKGEFAFEGTFVGQDAITFLGLMPADERKLNFPLLYANSLIINDIATKLGGKIFALGMYFTDYAEQLLGSNLLKQLVKFKQETDPQGILNPGKILPPGLDKNSPLKVLNTAMKGATMGKSLLGGLTSLLGGNSAKDHIEEKAKGPFSGAVLAESYICAQCGFCRTNCTVFMPDPWESNSPRGKWYILNEYAKGNIDLDETAVTALFNCTTCKKCDLVCQTLLPNAHRWLEMRPAVYQAGFINTGLELVKDNVVNSGNFWGVPAETKSWITPEIKYEEEGEIAYWPGCWASIIMKNMPQNIARIMNKAGVPFVYLGADEGCCGLYHALGGYMEEFGAKVKANYENLKKRGVKKLLLSCPGCFATFTENYPEMAHHLGIDWDIETEHVTVFLNRLLQEGKLRFTKPINAKVTYHDSCHCGRWFNIYEEPRAILKAIPGIELIEMEHNREKGLCCGLVASFQSIPTVGYSGQKRINEATATGAEYIVTNCAGCGSQMNFTSNMLNANVKQKDITDLVAEAMGIEEIYDPTAAIASYMEAAIKLLTPACIMLKQKYHK